MEPIKLFCDTDSSPSNRWRHHAWLCSQRRSGLDSFARHEQSTHWQVHDFSVGLERRRHRETRWRRTWHHVKLSNPLAHGVGAHQARYREAQHGDAPRTSSSSHEHTCVWHVARVRKHRDALARCHVIVLAVPKDGDSCQLIILCKKHCRHELKLRPPVTHVCHAKAGPKAPRLAKLKDAPHAGRVRAAARACERVGHQDGSCHRRVPVRQLPRHIRQARLLAAPLGRLVPRL